jgi:ribonuclease HI
MSEAVAVYSDGGVVKVNPSPTGGMWAACHVDAVDNLVWSASGVVLADPDDEFLPLVTNNQTEFRAMLAGLEALPDGWSGTVYADSLVTIRRFRDDARVAGIPLEWRKRMAYVLGRLGTLTYVLLDGHPTRAQLAAGVGKRGNPVSRWNVWCDEACTEEGRRLIGREPKRKRKDSAA